MLKTFMDIKLPEAFKLFIIRNSYTEWEKNHTKNPQITVNLKSNMWVSKR